MHAERLIEKLLRVMEQHPDTPLSVARLATLSGSYAQHVYKAIGNERERSGTRVFRIGGYVKDGRRRALGYLPGPGKDAPVIFSGNKARAWTALDIARLKQYVGTMPFGDMCNLLGREKRAVGHKLRELGYKKQDLLFSVPATTSIKGFLSPDTKTKVWAGGQIFRLPGCAPGITGITVHNTARYREDRTL